MNLAGKYIQFQPFNRGKNMFAEFMALAKNPEALSNSAIKLPDGFVKAMQRMSFG